MPELPEVTTVINTLKQNILGEHIKDIKINYGKLIKNVDEKTFKKSLIGEEIIDILRKGKYLIFVLTSFYMVVHLRMEGKFYLGDDKEINVHDHIIFSLTDKFLHFLDTRKFGTFYLFPKTTDIYKVEPLVNVGDEPFVLDYQELFKKAKKSDKPVKTFLLDQKNVSGLGNIYVDEVLFKSRINPFTSTKTLKEEDYKLLIENAILTLNKAIKLGGTTIRSFHSAQEVTGRFQNELLVHTKTVCPNCGLPIIKTKVGGRGTYYCPNCQKTNKVLIGICGRIGSGKSLVKTFLKYRYLNLDDVVKELYKNQRIRHKVISIIGESEFSKEKVWKALENKSLAQKITDFLYPFVYEKMFDFVFDSKEKVVVIEGAFLLESIYRKCFDKIVLISVSDDVIIKRLMARDQLSIEQAKTRLGLASKRTDCDIEIINNGTIEEFRKKVETVFKEIENGLA